MSFSGSPKGTPHDWCRRIMKKRLFCNENQWNSVVILKKMIHMFTGDLYSMYVVLQGIGSLPCIRVYIIYVIPFGSSNPGCAQVSEFDIAPGGALPAISCPVATSLEADAFALTKISSMSKGKTILWAWMSRGFLEPQTAADWHFDGVLADLENHMKQVKGAYADLLAMKHLPTLDKSPFSQKILCFMNSHTKPNQSLWTLEICWPFPFKQHPAVYLHRILLVMIH